MKNYFHIFKEKISDNPPAVLTFGFLFMILVGSFLLFLPFSSINLNFTNYIDCLFIATSSVCVTGLSTINITYEFNYIGKFIIMLLIQVGGLGFMTMATVVALILREKITLKDRLVIKEQMGVSRLSGMVKLIKYVIYSTFLVEFIGSILLSFVFVPKYGLKGIFYSVFHSISAFCNAGFDILGDNSLASFSKSPYFLTVISLLIIIGGIGFNVYIDILKLKFNFKKYSIHSKIVLVMTFSLLLIGTVLFFILEYYNDSTIENFNFKDKLFNSFFQSVTTRTAGFYSVNQSKFTESSSIITMFLMFIGGSPASCAGGLKTTTIFILVVTTISFIKNNDDIEAFKRRISFSSVNRAIGLLVISLLLVFVITFILSLIENFRYLDLLFETISAFATVGLSRNLTPFLKTVSKIILILLMFIGRLGPLTIIFSFYKKVNKKKIRYAKENVIVG